MKAFAALLPLAMVFALGCKADQALLEQQKSRIEEQNKMLAELKDTMDEQGEVIVEQIQMMAEMQETIDRQRAAMRETSESLRLCSQRL